MQVKPKMATEIPASITTPDTVETRLGTLRFFDGFPDDATVAKVFDNLDFQRRSREAAPGIYRPGPGQMLANNELIP